MAINPIREISLAETTAMMSFEVMSNGENAYHFMYKALKGGQIAVAAEISRWAIDFEETYKDREWDGEYYDFIDKFVYKKLKKLGYDWKKTYRI